MTEDIGTIIQDDDKNIFAYNLNIPITGKSYFKNSQIYAEVIGELNLAQVGNQEVDFGGQIIVEDGVVTHLAIEAPGEIKVSSAEAILDLL